MRYFLFIFIFTAVCACQNKSGDIQDENPILKTDLSKLKWIEGNWEGIYREAPFFENYKMVNDSTLLITSYANVGTPSVMTSHDYLNWKNGTYFLGSKGNYKVIRLDDKTISMIRQGDSANDVLWTFVNDSTWHAVLTSSADTITYIMKKVSPKMDSLLLSYETPPDSLSN